MQQAQLYRLVAAQLQDDGFIGAAEAVSKATLTPFPARGALPKQALRQQLDGDMNVLDILEVDASVLQPLDHPPYHTRCASS